MKWLYKTQAILKNRMWSTVLTNTRRDETNDEMDNITADTITGSLQHQQPRQRGVPASHCLNTLQ